MALFSIQIWTPLSRFVRTHSSHQVPLCAASCAITQRAFCERPSGNIGDELKAIVHLLRLHFPASALHSAAQIEKALSSIGERVGSISIPASSIVLAGDAVVADG